MVTEAVARRFWLTPSYAAVIAGGLACVAIAVLAASRANAAVAAEVSNEIKSRIYTPIARAEGQARSLASNAELREGLTERNRLKLTRAIRQTLPQMSLSYAGVLLPDGTPYFWFPDHERGAPIIAKRLPVDYELRTVGTLEYGAVLTDDFIRLIAAALSTEMRLVPSAETASPNSPQSPAASTPPTGTEVFASVAGRGDVGFAYLRAPEDPAGAVVATLEFHVPAASPGAARLRHQRNWLWALVGGAVFLVVGYDVRQRRRRAQPLPAFAPIPNPYIVGNPIRTREMFFGRDDDFQFARQKLTSEHAGLVLVFCGERRSGKTSILFQILSGRLGQEFLPVLIDMQYFAAISRDHDFYESVVGEIVLAAYPDAEQKERRRRFGLPSDSAAQSFELVLDDAMAAHPDKTFLFLFDEYEILESKIERGELSPMVIPYLAGLLERKRRISFIFTGSRNLEERPAAHWRLMLGKSQYRKISYLTPGDTERLITEPIAGRVQFEPASITMIVRLTSGQPFYTQVICQNLIDLLNEARRHIVTPADVSTIVDAIVDNPLPQMIYFWDSLPADEQIALSLLAEALGDEASWGTADSLLADAKEKGVPITTDRAALQFALERLFEQELLAKAADRSFRYRIDLLRHWIRRTHSIWQVVKEARSVPHAGA